MKDDKNLVEEKVEDQKSKESKKDAKKKKEDLTIYDLPGVGAATAEKLTESGYNDLMSIAVASPGELVEVAGVGEAVARKMINFARNSLDMGFESGDELLRKRANILKITTGCKNFDKLLGGGFESGSISECFGEFGASKCVAKDTTVFYFNSSKPHLDSFEVMYNKYKEKFGEQPYEEGFVVPVDCINVLGLTKNGLEKTKASMLYRQHADKVLRIKTRRGRIIDATKQHKLLTFKDNITWVPAGALKVGESLAYPKSLGYAASEDVSNNDAYFLGLFVAEGTSNPLSITNSSKVIIEWLRLYTRKRFGYEPRVSNKEGNYIVLFRKPTKDFLGGLVDSNSGTKFVPENVLNSSPETIRYFLAGYLDCDGSIQKGKDISMTTKSKRLAIDLSYALLRLGVSATYKLRKNEKGVYHSLYIVGDDRILINGLPLRIKDIDVRTRNSSYGFSGNMVNFLADCYRNSIGGNRGNKGKCVGRKKNDKDTFYHYITRSAYSSKTMNQGTLYKLAEQFVEGKNQMDELLILAENLEELNREKFAVLYDKLPFAFNSFAEQLGVSKSTLTNYRNRGLPKKDLEQLKVLLVGEIIRRRDTMEKAVNAIKGMVHFNWDEIMSVEEVDYSEFVYDFVVPDGHSFIAGSMPTVMHNSQIAHALAVNVQLPKDKGGANGGVIFIDGESTFRPERIMQIAKGVGLDPNVALKNIKIARSFNSDHQVLLAEKCEELIKENNVKLIIVDSLTSHFRADFAGRGQLADRQQKLNKHMHTLMRLAQKYNLCVYVTNQVMARPDVFFGDPTAAIGGNIVGHNCILSETLIQLSDGLIKPVEEIYNYSNVTSFDLKDSLKTNSRAIGTVVVKNWNGKVYSIKTTRKIKSSGLHRFFKIEDFGITEVRAEDLKEGDYLLQASNMDIEGEEQKLPKIEIPTVVKLSKKGSDLVKKEIEGINRKVICKNLHITPRQLRRVLNQACPTNLDTVYDLAHTYVGSQVFQFMERVETYKHRNYKIPETLNVEFAQILGYFLGDGNFEERSLRFRDARLDVLGTYNELSNKVFGVKGRVRKVNGKNCFNLDVNNKVVRDFVKEVYANLLDHITKSPKQHVCAFLKGFFDAEGSVSKKQVRISVSQSDGRLLDYMQLLLDRLGIRSAIRTYLHRGNRIYHLEIADVVSVLKYSGMVGFSASDKVEILNGMSEHCKNSFDQEMTPIKREDLWNLIKEFGIHPSRVLKPRGRKYLYVGMRELKKVITSLLNTETKYAELKAKLNFLITLINSEVRWEKIRKITTEEYDGFLYDFSVLGTENYIANGFIVHNSQTRIYLRKGKKGTRVAKLIDSPHLPDGEAIFQVTEEGLKDVD